MIRVILQPAYLLHARPYRDTSQILELFTKDHGRIAVVARGSRRSASTMKGLLQLFTPLFISYQGRGDLMTLTQVEPNGRCLSLKGNHLASAFYLNELLVRLLHRHDPHPFLFTTYQETLIALTDRLLNRCVLRIFEKRLLSELGYGLPLQETIVSDHHYLYDADRGFIISKDSENHYVFSGKMLLALHQENLSDHSLLAESKRLLQLALHPLLKNKPLNSRLLLIKETQCET